ncbi:hypothetical protein Q4512_05930 [Oceanihabitans sp. 2_MG-2023]|uniref:hypothetical protein n=1 Tax=Oceanihabitans sp. 2_MG-2023 TaxID=3062661 RepID=UPI0026E491EC|nr:hypothetical protein [Oceanihabitans sp. 2_MG-2023]MDO6596445.1 hypothetical protein [Oceanihabitans sp. 2_MG-2023]
MKKSCFTILLCLSFFFSKAQTPISKDSTKVVKKDSLKRKAFIQQLGNGYFPTKYFDIDLRYLVKYNQYEGSRNGLGGQTNNAFSEKIRFNTYAVYGFRDHAFKYSFGSGVKLDEKTNTWLNFSYTDDLNETGSSTFLTDSRFFQLFEPRLLNINLFHKHITKTISIERQLTPNLIGETEFATSNINTTYAYDFVVNNKIYNEIHLSTSKTALQWSPFSSFETVDNKFKIIKEGYPKFTLQYTKSFSDVFKSDFNFSKLDLRTIFKKEYANNAFSLLTITAGLASGETPLTHMYHAYPNNITKETIMQRFSVAGVTSFETMFFNEFFSDRISTFQFKHHLSPFKISKRFKPELVFISRFAIGNMSNINRHQQITFNTLEKGFTESGLEINKLFFGFGLSFTYRYGAYHLPKLEDNMALKFTFNVTL